MTSWDSPESNPLQDILAAHDQMMAELAPYQPRIYSPQQADALFPGWRERTLVPVLDFDRHAALIDITPFGPVINCDAGCQYGTCHLSMGDPYGCGGCCDCLRGCQVEYENHATAPILWEGDYA